MTHQEATSESVIPRNDSINMWETVITLRITWTHRSKHGFLVSHGLVRYYVKACSGRCASQVVPIASLSYNHNGSGLLIEREGESDETWLSAHKRVAVNQLLINKLLSVVSRRENSWFTSGSHCCPPRSTDTVYWLVCAPLTAYDLIHRHNYIYRVYILFPSPAQTFY